MSVRGPCSKEAARPRHCSRKITGAEVTEEEAAPAVGQGRQQQQVFGSLLDDEDGEWPCS